MAKRLNISAKDKISKPSNPTQKALAEAIKRFRIDAKVLAPEIERAAFSSGQFPYPKTMKSKPYARELAALQIELIKVQDWVQATGERVVIVFEGRDAAGKGGAIHRFTQHLNPRHVRVVALTKPTDVEQGQWYFQRYVDHLPTKGEIVIFDRSWYNRAGVELVMGYCKPADTERFLAQVPVFEKMLTDDGIHVFKLFLTIGHAMQLQRFHVRHANPLKDWKLSPFDIEAIKKWDAYSAALDAMLERSESKNAPWTIIKANDKRRARLAAMRQVLAGLPYAGKDKKIADAIDRKIAWSAKEFLANGGEM